MGGQLLHDAGMFTSRGVLAEPARKTGELAHVSSHELPRQHAGVDGLLAHNHASARKQSAYIHVVRSRYLGGQQRPVLSRADAFVHQISIRDGVSCLAEQHQVGLQVTPVMR